MNYTDAHTQLHVHAKKLKNVLNYSRNRARDDKLWNIIFAWDDVSSERSIITIIFRIRRTFVQSRKSDAIPTHLSNMFERPFLCG